nr:MAG TPA: hypothetical protein [Caudoviricetes sp.]
MAAHLLFHLRGAPLIEYHKRDLECEHPKSCLRHPMAELFT